MNNSKKTLQAEQTNRSQWKFENEINLWGMGNICSHSQSNVNNQT